MFKQTRFLNRFFWINQILLRKRAHRHLKGKIWGKWNKKFDIEIQKISIISTNSFFSCSWPIQYSIQKSTDIWASLENKAHLNKKTSYKYRNGTLFHFYSLSLLIIENFLSFTNRHWWWRRLGIKKTEYYFHNRKNCKYPTAV